MRRDNSIIQEEWRDIPGYEGLYQISSIGRVKSLPKYHSKEDRILKGHIDKDGYIKVRLCPNSKERKTYFVHRLVGLAFISNERQLPEIDHINTITSDNRVENLRWVNRSMNQLNEITRRRLSESNLGRKWTDEQRKKHSLFLSGRKHGIPALLKANHMHRSPVLMLDQDRNIILAFESIKEASSLMNIEKRRISDVCNNKRNKAGGFIWRKI